MADLANYPLEDNFKTSLSQTWTWWTGTMNVVWTPNFTFPSGITTYVVVNPWNTNMQIAEINAYDSSAKTLTVSNITLEKGASVNSTAQTHNVGSEVIISDNYEFWKDIATAINSKLDNDTDWTWGAATDFAWMTAKSLTTAQRTALTGVNWMIVYDTDLWVHYQYIGWSWSTFATWTTSNASETVAGKVEIATDAEVTAGTGTGWTGAVLSVTPTQANTLVSLATTDTTSSDTDYYVFQDAAASDVNKRITQANLRDSLAASETVKGTVERATDAEAITWTDTTRYISPASNKAVNEDLVGTSSDITITTWSSWNIQATAAGFVSVYAEPTWSASFNINIYTDATATPTTKVAWFTNIRASCMYPIKKDDYYRVENDDESDTTNEVYKFIPLG